MKYHVKDISGQRFGKLTVIELTGRKTKSGNAIWRCICDCGNITEADSGALRVGNKKSCGCAIREHAANLNKTHGGRNERLYLVWMDMKRRCRDKRNYRGYGDRGITVCKEWEDYAVFREWAMQTGYDPNAEYFKCTLDRIDVNGNYEPSNCRWADSYTQQNNKRNNKYITYNGKTQTMKQWANELKVGYGLLAKRVAAGWDFERAVTEPSRYEKISHGKKPFDISTREGR